MLLRFLFIFHFIWVCGWERIMFWCLVFSGSNLRRPSGFWFSQVQAKTSFIWVCFLFLFFFSVFIRSLGFCNLLLGVQWDVYFPLFLSCCVYFLLCILLLGVWGFVSRCWLPKLRQTWNSFFPLSLTLQENTGSLGFQLVLVSSGKYTQRDNPCLFLMIYAPAHARCKKF
jgi:hypothetical protein